MLSETLLPPFFNKETCTLLFLHEMCEMADIFCLVPSSSKCIFHSLPDFMNFEGIGGFNIVSNAIDFLIICPRFDLQLQRCSFHTFHFPVLDLFTVSPKLRRHVFHFHTRHSILTSFECFSLFSVRDFCGKFRHKHELQNTSIRFCQFVCNLRSWL